MALASSPADPPSSASTPTPNPIPAPAPPGTTTPRLPPNPPPPSRDPRSSTLSLPQTHIHYIHSRHPPPPHLATSYPPTPSQLQPPLFLPNLAPRVPANSIHPQFPAKSPHPPQGILYPVASSSRSFLQRANRPHPSDQKVTIVNPGNFRPRPAYSHPVRPFGFPHSDPQGQAVHLVRPTHLQHTLVGSTGGVMSSTVKGVPATAHLKIAPSQPPVLDSNGYKDPRKWDGSRDDSLATVRKRKVRIYEGSSLYALCRSWLRNGFPEESQPQYVDGLKLLPKPLPIQVAENVLPEKKEGDKEEEEEEESVEHLSPKDLLQRHIKRAKRVRSQLREERLQRIARYKTRLALLLPPLVEQQTGRN